MKRVPLTELLCVHCPVETRAHVETHLRRLHPASIFTVLDSGWIVVESPWGPPASPLIGSRFPLRVVLGDAQLCGLPPKPSAVADTVALASDRPERLHELPGDFCFVVLEEGGVATAVRSCHGIPRLFTFHKNSVTAIGTRLEWVAQVYPTALELNPNRLVSELLTLGVAPNHGSALHGIGIVPVGHSARCGRWETPRLTRYWDVGRIAPVEASLDEVATELERALTQELVRHLAPNTSNAVFVSGGLDSSLLAVLCTEHTDLLDAVSFLPPRDHPAHALERYYIAGLAGMFRQHVAEALHRPTWVERARSQPGSLIPDFSPEWQLLNRLDEPPATLVSGWFADECYGHQRLTELLHPTLPDLRTLLSHWSFDEAWRRWLRRRRTGRSAPAAEGAQVPPIFDTKATSEYVGWLRSAVWEPRPERPLERLRYYLRVTDEGGAFADIAAPRGARFVAPFASRAAVELTAGTSLATLFGRGELKAPIRRLLKRRKLTAVATRSDKGNWAAPPMGPLPVGWATERLAGVLDTSYPEAHPTLSLEEIVALICVETLERGRERIEHDRRSIWP